MRSSHVGSFPLSYSRENIARVLRDLQGIGLDVPTYPQLRSFIDIYLKPLEALGIVYSKRGSYFSTLKHLEVSPPRVRIDDAEIAIGVISREGLAFKALRGPVTGVFTLASRVYLSEDISRGLQATVLANRDITMGFFREFVASLVRYMSSLGYGIVFIDEPSLSLFIGRRVLYGWTEDSVVEVLSSIAKAAEGAEVGIHVCGQLNPKLLDIIARVDRVKYLSFEFFKTPLNLELLNKSLLEQHNKVISPGIVSTSSLRIESIEEALAILTKVYSKAGGRVDLVSGDCGFGGLRGSLGDEEKEYRISIEKLRIVVEAVKRFCQVEKC
uniref:Methionine synthase n=1 Tax=Ignisphaera aggregans TaxID=334771 RepID=A0A7C4BC87_9CREN